VILGSLFDDVNGGAERLQIVVGMRLQILLRWINFGSFLMVLAIFVHASIFSTMVIRTLESFRDVDQIVMLIFRGIMVLAVLPTLLGKKGYPWRTIFCYPWRTIVRHS
jgi:hypothetical protein